MNKQIRPYTYKLWHTHKFEAQNIQIHFSVKIISCLTIEHVTYCVECHIYRSMACVCLCVCVCVLIMSLLWIEYIAQDTLNYDIFLECFFFPLCIDNVLNVTTHASESNSKYENWKSHISTRIAKERNGFWEQGEKFHCWELVVMLVGMNVFKNVGFVATMFRSNLPGNIDNSSVNLILPVVSLYVCECGYGCHDLCRLSTVSGVFQTD